MSSQVMYTIAFNALDNDLGKISGSAIAMICRHGCKYLLENIIEKVVLNMQDRRIMIYTSVVSYTPMLQPINYTM